MKNLILIAAVSENGVIGKDGKMPWHIKEDLQHFKKLTLNHPIIMGRKTYDSLPVKPLLKRRNIVVTNNKEYSAPGAEVTHSIDEALELCKNEEDVYVIGGQKIYEQTINKANKLELTRILKEYEGDAFFPEIKDNEWIITKAQFFKDYKFLSYDRIVFYANQKDAQYRV